MTDSKDPLGDRIKRYEAQSTEAQLMRGLPIIIRLDGNGFHSFTKGLDRPFDKGLSDLMIETATFALKFFQGKIAYTQSDEISLLVYEPDIRQDLFFAGKLFKWASIGAAKTSVYFNYILPQYLDVKKQEELPSFDCRVFQVPNKTEAYNAFLWRELDATKNSVSMAARAYYSHKAMNNKNSSEKQEMLWQKGVNWNNYPTHFKRGTYVQKQEIERVFTTDELEALPEKHNARQNPNLVYKRSVYQPVNMPPLTQLANPLETLFDGAEPRYKTVDLTQPGKPHKAFSGDLSFLSNMYPRAIKGLDGHLYPSSENYYQAQKEPDETKRYEYMTCKPVQAKQKAKEIEAQYTDDEKLGFMRNALTCKFAQHPDLLDKLRHVPDEQLVETNYWHDNFWGNCTCARCKDIEGLNHLGRVLRKVKNVIHTS